MRKLFFIDHVTYDAIIDKKLSLLDLANSVINRQQLTCKISSTTHRHLVLLNEIIEDTIFLDKADCCKAIEINPYKETVTDKEIETNVKRFLLEIPEYETPKEKYYDLKRLPDGISVVVLEEGCLRYLLRSKDTLKAFYLTVLQHEYDANEPLVLGDYIDLMIKDSVFNLMVAKLS